MALQLQHKYPLLDTSTHLLGCMDHVINLGAKFGLEFLGGINNKDDDGKQILIGETYPKEAAKAVMKISSLTNITNTSIKLKTILERIHTIHNYVLLAPQHQEQLCDIVKFFQPKLQKAGAEFICLEIDVSTWWNSKNFMFNQSIELRKSCTHFCKENLDTQPQILSNTKWDQVANIIELSKPLREATHMLYASTYLT